MRENLEARELSVNLVEESTSECLASNLSSLRLVYTKSLQHLD